jgi:predicted RNA-binding protein YlqC (UPF0109 family)
MLIGCSAPNGVVFRATPFFFWKHRSDAILCAFVPISIYSCLLRAFHHRLTYHQPLNRSGGEAMKDLITEIVKALVDQPEQVKITELAGEHTNVLELSVAKSDMGKVIGKQGRNAQAIRTILNAASAKSRKRYVLEIVE